MKTKLLAATALVLSSFTPALMTPAVAIPPVVDTTGMTPDEVCEELLKPNNPNSKFLTAPSNVQVGEWMPDGAPYPDLDNPLGDPEGYGTPVASNVITEDSFFRNGGSPNVWAEATATLTYPQTRQLYAFLQDVTRTTSFDCDVWKVNPNDNTVDPAGLQSTGNQSVETDTMDADPDYVITDEPFVEYDQAVYALICISPNNVTKGKPGTWVGKNGFDPADCQAASDAAGGNIPSGNAPTV